MNFDIILNDYIHPLGIWQWVIFVVVNLTTYANLSMFPQLSSLLPNHHCKFPVLEEAGWSDKLITDLAIPETIVKNKTKINECEQYNVSKLITDVELNHTSFIRLDVARILAEEMNMTIQEIPCQNGWWYNQRTAKFQHSFSEEFNLVCKSGYLIPISTSMYVAGTMLGRAGGGFVADRFGRKPVMMTASLTTFVFGVLVGFSPNVWTFCLFRFIVGVTSNAAVIVGIVMWSEITTDKHRNTLGGLFGVHESFVIPSLNVLLAYVTQDWRLLHILLVTYYGFAIFHICLIKDSPRWLLIKNRVPEAMDVIRRAIRWNRGKGAVSEQTLEQLEVELSIAYKTAETESKAKKKLLPWYQTGLLSLITDKRHRQFTLPLLVIWFVVMMGVLGFAFYAVRLKHSSPYLVAFVGFFVSLPAMFLKYLLYNYFDRKRPLAAVFIVAGIVCAIQAVLRGFGIQGAVSAVLSSCALCCALVAQNMAYTLTTECYPTSCRNYATGLTSGLGRFGAVVATFVARLDYMVWAPLPMIIFSLASFLAMAMVFILPHPDTETLPDFSKSSESIGLHDSNDNGNIEKAKTYGTNDDRDAPVKDK